MKKFHITITNNETQVVERDFDTSCIIGAAAGADGYTSVFCLSSTTGREIVATAAGALRAADEAMKDMPPFLRTLVKTLASEGEDE